MHTKTHFGEDIAELLQLSGEPLSQYFFEGHTKQAASKLFSRQDIQDLSPPPGKFAIHKVVMGSEEKYGCVAADTKIALPDGKHAPMIDVKVGDIVLSGAGVPRKVAHKFEYDLDHAIEVTVGGVPFPLIVSPNHPFMVASKAQFVCPKDKYCRCLPPSFGNQNICKRASARNTCAVAPYFEIQHDYKPAEGLEPGDFLTFKLPDIKPLREVDADEALIIGYWLAEGSFGRNSINKQASSLRFDLDITGEEDYVAELTAAGERQGWTPHIYSCPERSTTTIVFNGNAERVREYESWFMSGAWNKCVPLWLCGLPQSCITKLLVGYFKGDGALYTDPERALATTVSYDLATGIQRLLWAVGILGCVYYYETGERKPGSMVMTPFKGYRVGYAYSGAAGSELQFCKPTLEQSTKVHGFVHAGMVYLPLRGLDILAWNDKIYTIEVEDDHSYVSGGIWSKNSNRNHDGYPRDGLIKNHHTFVKVALCYREHENRDRRKNLGSIKASRWDPKLERVETVSHVDIDKAPEEYEMAKQGKELAFSQSCKVKEDVCNICQHRAPKPSMYCRDIKQSMGKYLPEHRKYAYVSNPDPIFFDESFVKYGADRIARYLEYKFADDQHRKAAAAEGTIPETISGSDWSELIGTDKQASPLDPASRQLLTKLAAIEKAYARSCLDGIKFATGSYGYGASLDRGSSLNDQDVQALRRMAPSSFFRKTASAGIILPFDVFLAYSTDRLLSDVRSDPETKRASMDLPGMFGAMEETAEDMAGVDKCCQDDVDMFAAGGSYGMQSDPAAATAEIDQIMDKVTDDFSLAEQPVQNRCLQVAAEKSASVRAEFRKSAAIKVIENKSTNLHPMVELYGAYKIAAVRDINRLRNFVCASATPEEFCVAQNFVFSD